MQPDLDLDLSKTYIYDGVEYMLTGRVAEREQDLIPKRRRRTRRQRPEDESSEHDLMVEIKPAPTNGRSAFIENENKWVKYNDLYAVMNILEDED